MIKCYRIKPSCLVFLEGDVGPMGYYTYIKCLFFPGSQHDKSVVFDAQGVHYLDPPPWIRP